MSIHVHLAQKKRKSRRKVVAISRRDLAAAQVPGFEPGVMLDSQHLLITALLPPAVKDFLAQCEAEVASICGQSHARGEGLLSRWGTQAGSIYLGGQKVAIQKPRVRGRDGERRLETYEQFQDPKLGAVIALGVGAVGRKHVLGLYQSSTESSAACRELLDDLERRGLPEDEVLFVVDGGSGLNKALDEKYEIRDPKTRRACRVRCFVHQWRNLADVLDEKQCSEVAPLFWAIREARDLTQALECSNSLERVLGRFNASALASYLEAKEDLLALHRLGLSAPLRTFFSTTNPIESLNSLLEEDMRRVKRWRDSAHFQRWLATACLSNEKRMRRIRGYRALPALVVRLHSLCSRQSDKVAVDSNAHAA